MTTKKLLKPIKLKITQEEMSRKGGKSSWSVRIRNKTPEEVKQMMSELGKKGAEARILNLKK